MNKEFGKSIEDLRKFSSIIGNNLELIQGAGGNTSLKENNILWIKASGCWLSDAKKNNIFVPVECNEVYKSIEIGDLSAISIKESNSNNEDLKPSIETAFHALMPHKVVFHAHALNSLSVAILLNGKEYLQQFLHGVNWAWIPYFMPGIDLAMAIRDKVKLQPSLDVIILANHGIVVGGSSIEKTFELLLNIEKRIIRNVRNTKDSNEHELLSVIRNSKYRLPTNKIIHKIALDEIALKIVNTGVLYPDHVVFLGSGPINVLTINELKNFIFNEDFIDSNLVVVVRDYGVVVNKDISENAEAMLYCLAGVLLRVQSGENLSYLSEDSEKQLIEWDAEKYRKSIQR